MNPLLSKKDYYNYNYHSNMIEIYNDWLKIHKEKIKVNQEKHRKIITLLHHSLQIKDAIDVMWRQQEKSENNQKLLKDISLYMDEIKKYYQSEKNINIAQIDIEISENKFPFMKKFISQENDQNPREKNNKEIQKIDEETYNKYLTLINAERVYLSVARSFFSYLLRNSWYFDSVRELNTFSLIMANYLYFIRLHLKLYVMLTIKTSEKFNEMSYWERAYGYLIANQRQFLNDFFWSVVLFSISLNLYFKNTQIDKFLSQNTTTLGINLFIGITLLFDVWNSARAVKELDENWKTLISEHPELKDDLEEHYQKIRRDKLAFVYYTQSICAVNLISGILEVLLFIAENNHTACSESLTHIIPFLNIALIGMMFVSQFFYLTRDYWDIDFQKLPNEEKNKIQIKAMNQAIEEALKIVIIAIIIFVIASQIPFSGIPQMLILALLTICMIAFVKALKEWLEPQLMKFFNSSEGEPLQAST